VSGPDLVVDSTTGVDVRLPVADAGGRAFAFLIDWHIRLIVALAWYVVAALLYNRAWSLRGPADPTARWFMTVLVPGLAFYFLYHPVLEIAMRGRTPGKRVAGVRIVSRTGATPSLGSLLMRNVFRLIDGFPGFYAVGLIATFVTRDHVRIGDLAAGTLLVYERAALIVHEPQATPAAGAADPEVAELAAELLARWSQLADDARDGIARTLLSRARRAAAPDAGLEALRAELARLAEQRA
jgi:uncharacterized RDD family membrane protein YckC